MTELQISSDLALPLDATIGKLPQHIASKIAPADAGCWAWTGTIKDSGYGQVSYRNRQHRAHRLVYELLVAPIPDGYELDHLCHTNAAHCPRGSLCLHRRCVNPAHLEIVTGAENTRRRSAAVLTCHRGHPYDEINTRMTSTGRRCRACAEESPRQRRHDPSGEFASLVRSVIAEGVSQGRIARTLGITQSAVSRWAAGYPASIEMQQAFAATFSIASSER